LELQVLQLYTKRSLKSISFTALNDKINPIEINKEMETSIYVGVEGPKLLPENFPSHGTHEYCMST